MNTTLTPHKPERDSARGDKRWVPALLLGILLGMAGLALISRQADSPWGSRWFGGLLGRSTRVDVSQPTVVHKIQQLQRLETVVYTMDKVVSGEKENAILPNFLAGDRLLMVVHGEVVAGGALCGVKRADAAPPEKKKVPRPPPAP